MNRSVSPYRDKILRGCFRIQLRCSMFVLLWLSFCAFMNSSGDLNKKGNEHYNNKRYQSALESYQKAQVKDPKRQEILYNIGTTLYQIDQFQEASKTLEKMINATPEQKTKTSELARYWYNYGNSQYRTGQFDEAIKSYKKVLEMTPHDKDAKHNLEFLLNKKSVFENEQKERDQNRQDQERPQDQNPQQNNQSQQNQNQQQNQPDSQEQQDQPDQQDESKDQVQQQPQDGKHEQERQDQSESNQNNTQQQEQQQDRLDQQAQEPPEDYLQGQMSKEDALRILEALRGSEQELLQNIRRPGSARHAEFVEKDW